MLLLSATLVAIGNLDAQTLCDPTLPPSNLQSTYVEGSGATLTWDAVPGSIGVQIKATSPTGTNVTRRLVGATLDQYFVPDAVLETGFYDWRVQAACSSVFPYDVTPISASDSFEVTEPFVCPPTVTDIDGNTYATVAIGGQCWMSENLATESYSDGSVISTTWSSSSGARAIYGDVLDNKATYGLLYNWYAVNDARGLCPTSWHVPSDAEWTALTDHLGGLGVAGGALKATGSLPDSTGLWAAPNTGASNSSGFSALPGGGRSVYNIGSYDFMSTSGYWWSFSPNTASSAWSRRMLNSSESVIRSAYSKTWGLSVRCLQD